MVELVWSVLRLLLDPIQQSIKETTSLLEEILGEFT